MERGEYRGALQILYRIHAEDPSSHRTHHLIGLCYFHLEEFDKALAAFERALAARAEPVSHLYAARSAERLANAPVAPPADESSPQDPAAEPLSASRRASYLHQAQTHYRGGLAGG